MLHRTPGYASVSCSQQITANIEYMTLQVTQFLPTMKINYIVSCTVNLKYSSIKQTIKLAQSIMKQNITFSYS